MISTKKIINILIVIQIFSVIFSEIIYSYNNSLGFIFFIPDIINVFLFIIVVARIISKGNISIKSSPIIFGVVVLFFIYTTMSFLWSDMNWYRAISRMRYMFGGFFYYIVCSRFLENEVFTKIIDMLFIVQFLNLILSIYQCQVWGLHPDFSNGIFGFTGYSNGIEGTFCLALSLLALIYYLSMRWSLLKSSIMIGMSAIICAVAEIKIYFVIFVVCALIIVLLQKRTFKEKVRLILIGISIGLILIISYKIIEIILPDNLTTFFSIKEGLRYEDRTTYAGRTNTIPFVFENLFKNNIWSSLIGTGLGSNSQDYIYELGKTFSDHGFIGVLLLYLFLLLNFSKALFNREYVTSEQLFVSVFSVGMMISIIVWNAFFTRTTYVVFFFISISFMTYMNKGKSGKKYE